jgi:hypothetical protein
MPDKSQSQKVLDQLMQGMMKPAPESLYHQLGRLREQMPATAVLAKPESSKWIGRVLAVVEAAECTIELVHLRMLVDYMHKHGAYANTAQAWAQHMDTVLAKLELKVPTEMQGAFIPAGGVFDGFAAVSRAMSPAKSHVFIVDPYSDDQTISGYVPLAPEGLPVYLLTDAASVKPSLKPAVEKWKAQYQAKRPLEVRVTPAKSLHDRLIITDNTTVFTVGQSLKDLAKRAPSSLVRMGGEPGDLKIQAHVALWQAATVL